MQACHQLAHLACGCGFAPIQAIWETQYHADRVMLFDDAEQRGNGKPLAAALCQGG